MNVFGDKVAVVTGAGGTMGRAVVDALAAVGRFCKPEEFAHVVAFLPSPPSAFITDEIVDLNGGLRMD